MSTFNARSYWIGRYEAGGDSGWGSWDESSVKFKAEYVNDLIKKYDIKTICELGCGDGNQLGKFSGYTKYYGYDISSAIVLRCKLLYQKNSNKIFYEYLDDVFKERYDLSLSLDVIYHLVDDKTYINYMYNLFSISDRVCIFSSDNINPVDAVHVKNRPINKFIESNFSSFKLVDTKMFNENVGFFLYEKKSNGTI